MKKILLPLFFILLTAGAAQAEEKINEEELFSDPGSVVASGARGEKIEEEKKTFALSGEAVGVLEYSGTRDWIEDGNDEGNRIYSYVLGKFYIDARLKRGTKYFGNLEVQNSSLSEKTDFAFRESFIDFNVKRAVYVRGGKQVLQWGRCFLWNPSDLINVEKKTFIKKIGSREGTFGVKFHAPFGTKYNLYGFIDTNKAEDLDDTAVAGKFEFVLKNTEMAFSIWYKDGFNPVYAYDVSTRLFGIDTAAEVAATHGDNIERITVAQGALTTSREDGWVPRASIDFGRSFDFREVNDRIRVNLEFYYDGSGYTENVFDDPRIYPFAVPVAGVSGGTKRDFLLLNNLYEPNYHSKYYAAVFASMTKFIVSDMSLSLNLIRNLNDDSSILTTGVSYTDINDFSAGFNVYAFMGGADSEYTFSGNAVTGQLTVGVAF